MMKKPFLIVAVLILMMLNGCSFLSQANQTLDYVNKATTHINNMQSFANQAPQMIQQAALNADVKKELTNQLNALKQEIEQFSQVNPPSIAKDIHQQIVSNDQLILKEINKVMVNGEVVIDQLQNSQLLTTISQVNSLLGKLQTLGQ